MERKTEFKLKSNSIIIISDLRREAFCSTFSVLAPKGDDSSSPWAAFLGGMGWERLTRVLNHQRSQARDSILRHRGGLFKSQVV